MSTFYIEVSETEIIDILKEGSQNQQTFINKAIAADAADIVLEIIEELIEEGILTTGDNTPFDILGNITAGAIFLTGADYGDLNPEDFLTYKIKPNLILMIE